MHQLLQQIFSGLAVGAIYGSVALALVMIYRATDLINFAQGEMAMFSTYIAWTLVNAGLPFWAAFVITLAVSFLGGMTIERILIRPVENAPVLASVIVTIALALIFNSLAGWIYSYTVQDFPSPFPDRPILGALITTNDLGVIVVTLLMLALLFCFSASRPPDWRCARPRRIRFPRGCAVFRSGACWRSAGAWRRRSARPPASWWRRCCSSILT